MSNTVKNAVLIFTLVCAIFLVVFVFELIMVNRDRDAGDNGPGPAVASEQTEPGYENGDAIVIGNGEEQGDENGEDENGDENGGNDAITIPVPSEGVQFRLPMPAEDREITMVIYADEELFEFSEGEMDWLFALREGDGASLEIASEMITPPHGLSGRAEVLLRGYLGGGESTVMGEAPIGESGLTGYAVAGESVYGVYYEAWLYSFSENPDVGLAVALIINYRTDEERALLFGLLDSIEMESDEEEYGDEEDE